MHRHLFEGQTSVSTAAADDSCACMLLLLVMRSCPTHTQIHTHTRTCHINMRSPIREVAGAATTPMGDRQFDEWRCSRIMHRIVPFIRLPVAVQDFAVPSVEMRCCQSRRAMSNFQSIMTLIICAFRNAKHMRQAASGAIMTNNNKKPETKWSLLMRSVKCPRFPLLNPAQRWWNGEMYVHRWIQSLHLNRTSYYWVTLSGNFVARCMSVHCDNYLNTHTARPHRANHGKQQSD